jgi:hypothetical protein
MSIAHKPHRVRHRTASAFHNLRKVFRIAIKVHLQRTARIPLLHNCIVEVNLRQSNALNHIEVEPTSILVKLHVLHISPKRIIGRRPEFVPISGDAEQFRIWQASDLNRAVGGCFPATKAYSGACEGKGLQREEEGGSGTIYVCAMGWALRKCVSNAVTRLRRIEEDKECDGDLPASHCFHYWE